MVISNQYFGVTKNPNLIKKYFCQTQQHSSAMLSQNQNGMKYRLAEIVDVCQPGLDHELIYQMITLRAAFGLVGSQGWYVKICS